MSARGMHSDAHTLYVAKLSGFNAANWFQGKALFGMCRCLRMEVIKFKHGLLFSLHMNGSDYLKDISSRVCLAVFIS